MTMFETFEDAQDEFYENHTCDSDDVEKELARVEEWLAEENHEVAEDLPENNTQK